MNPQCSHSLSTLLKKRHFEHVEGEVSRASASPEQQEFESYVFGRATTFLGALRATVLPRALIFAKNVCPTLQSQITLAWLAYPGIEDVAEGKTKYEHCV